MKWFTINLLCGLLIANKPSLGQTSFLLADVSVSQNDVRNRDKALNACLTLSTEQDKDIVALKQAVKKLENDAADDSKASFLPAYIWVLVGGYLGITATMLLKR